MNPYDRLDAVISSIAPAARPTDPALTGRLFHRLADVLTDLPSAGKTPHQQVQREDQR